MLPLFKMTAAMLFTVVAANAYAGGVAVADSQVAVMSSNIAQQTLNNLNTSLKPQRDRLEALVKDIQAIKTRVEKDAKVMSADDAKKIQNEYQAKVNEYNSTSEGLQKRVEAAQADMIKVIMPKMEAVVTQIRTEGGYDVIIEKKNVIWAADTIDITKKITERLNASK